MKALKLFFILLLIAFISVNIYSDIDFKGLRDLSPQNSLRDVEPGFIGHWGSSEYDLEQVPQGDDFVAIATGDFHAIALRSDGSLVGWGAGTVNTGSFPHYGQSIVPTGNNFVAIATGSLHSVALREDGSLVAWGRNNYNQTNVPSGNDFVAIACGTHHSIALRENGSLTAWGAGTTDQGSFPHYGQSIVPQGNDFQKISGGVYHSLALKNDGTLVAWGRNNYGQTDVPDGDYYVSISTNNYHNLALTESGAISAWGRNTSGQCNVPAGHQFSSISAGWEHSLAIKTDGTLVAWGLNLYGQTDVVQGNHHRTIASGYQHNFSIGKIEVNMVSPNGGETWQAGTEKNISWFYKGFSLPLTLQFTADNGETWIDITSVNTDDCSYSWNVPTLESSACRVRGFFIYEGSEFSMESNYNFAITTDELPYVLVTYPSQEGINFQTGKNYQIQWESWGVENIDLDYSIDNGNSWLSIAEGLSANSGSYNWNVPETPSNYARVRVRDSDEPLVFHSSSEAFSIILLEFATNMSNLELTGGENILIQLNAVNSQRFRLFYSVDQGTNWVNIVNDLQSQTYNWIVPNIESDVTLLKVQDYFDPDIYSFSFPFSINSPILLSSPSGGENIQIGEIFQIEWFADSSISYVLIDYSTDGGIIWQPVRVVPYPASEGFYDWLVPDTPSAECLLRVRNYQNENTYAINQEFFTISNKTLEFISDLDGEILYPGSFHEIEWYSVNINNIVLEYSYNGGDDWLLIEDSIDASLEEYIWLVPEIGTNYGKVRVSDMENPMINSESDGFFQIVFYNPPRNLTAEINNDFVELSWESPYGVESRESKEFSSLLDRRNIDDFTGYNIYRDEVLISEELILLNHFIDYDVEAEVSYKYYVTAVYGENESIPSNIVEVKITSTSELVPVNIVTQLIDNYPNPFNPQTSIRFSLSEDSRVSINVYNIKGQLISKLLDDHLSIGYHQVVWDGRDIFNKQQGSGIYFYSLRTKDFYQVNKMMLIK